MYYDDIKLFDRDIFIHNVSEFNGFGSLCSLNHTIITTILSTINGIKSFNIGDDIVNIKSINTSYDIRLSTKMIDEITTAYHDKTSLYNIIHENNRLYFIPKTPRIAYDHTRLFDDICLDILRIPNIPRDVLFEIMCALMWIFIDDRTKYAYLSKSNNEFILGYNL